MQTEEFLARIDDDKMTAAIETAEQNTSGEIRVFITRNKVEDAMEVARKEFEKLGMQHTAERNAVLIFVAPKSQTFAILGDSGIHAKCGERFWEEISAIMSGHFREGRYTEGLVAGILQAGQALSQYFPYQESDKNELPNTIVRD
ncbi:MAG: TPM domain-containing protein [Verrucomicrobiales bacterium]